MTDLKMTDLLKQIKRIHDLSGIREIVNTKNSANIKSYIDWLSLYQDLPPIPPKVAGNFLTYRNVPVFIEDFESNQNGLDVIKDRISSMYYEQKRMLKW